VPDCSDWCLGSRWDWPTGRLGWQAVAGRVPLSDLPPLALAAALLLVPVLLILANLPSLWAGEVALAPADDLRAE
jgi:hypothetical protein